MKFLQKNLCCEFLNLFVHMEKEFVNYRQKEKKEIKYLVKIKESDCTCSQ
jgi:hypothetical protein